MKSTKNKRTTVSVFYPIFFIVSLILVMMPFFHNGVIRGADDSFHITRLQTLALALQRGEFPVKFHADECFGYGYGVGYFYSNFFLYFPAVLMLLGMSINTAFKIFIFVLFIAIFFSMFISTYFINGKNFSASFVSASLYIVNHSLIVMLYHDFAIGQCLSMIFFPLALSGIYIIVSKKSLNIKIGQILLIVGFSGLLYSHVLGTLLATLACFIILLLNIKNWFNNKKKWGALIESVIAVCMLTASYWIPLLEQYRKQYLKCYAPYIYPADHVVSIKNLFTFNGIGYIIGILLLSLTVACIYRITKKNIDNDLITFIVVSWLFTIFTTFQAFWNLMNMHLYTLQFPGRLFSIATVCISFSLSLILTKINIKEKYMISLTIILFIFSFSEAMYWHITQNDKYNLYYDYTQLDPSKEWAGLSTGEEYLPMETQREYFVDCSLAIDSLGNKIIGTKTGNTYTFCWSDSSAEETTVPFVWYKGFEATDENGKQLPVDKNEKYGFVRVCAPEGETIPAGTEITVTIKFTKYTQIAYIINILGIIYLIFLLLHHRVSLHEGLTPSPNLNKGNTYL